jgi:hypothetical protein
LGSEAAREAVSEARDVENRAEAAFEEKAGAAGWKVAKRGWRDFFMLECQGQIFVAEKAGKNHRLKAKSSGDFAGFFADHGIPAYRWDPENGFKRVRTNPQRHARSRSWTRI